MHSFKDAEGREWQLAVNAATIKRARTLTGLNLWELMDNGAEPYLRLVKDPLRFSDVLFALCKPQAEKDGVTQEAFDGAFYGDAVGAAERAFGESYADFFDSPEKRQAFRAMLAKVRELEAEQQQKGKAEMQAALDGITASSPAPSTNGSSGSTSDRSEATPASAPTAS